MERVEYLLNSCVAQAKWHLEQYKKFNYYATYYRCLYESYSSKWQEERSRRNTDVDAVDWNEAYTNIAGNCSYEKTNISPERKKKKRKKKRKSYAEKIESDDENNEFEMDESFKEFLLKSAEHRKQRDAEKAKQVDEKSDDVSMECVEYVDVLRKGPEGTVLPPTAFNRKQIYEEKYGAKGTTILSLETALQWKYNKFIDSMPTSPWPALPLRFK